MAHRGWGKRLAAVTFLAVGAFLMSGCSTHEAMRFGWPAGITPESQDMRHLWTWSVIAALILGILVWGALFWTITFHRRPRNGGSEFPRQTAYNLPLELTLTAIPFVIIAVLFAFTVAVQNKVEAKSANPPIVVDVTAFQWNWKFGYRTVDVPGVSADNGKGLLHMGSSDEIEGDNVTAEKKEQEEHPLPDNGRSSEDTDYLAYDKVETIGSTSEVPVLVLPSDTRVEFVLAAKDVVHSFWIPEFLFKRDVMPFPKQNHTDNVFQISKIEKTGAFVGRCAEMCGTYHSMMNFELRVVSPENFVKYYNARVIDHKSNADALSLIGESPVATTTHPFLDGRGDLVSNK